MKKSDTIGRSPKFILEFDIPNIKQLVFDLINISSIFLWDTEYKDPTEDKNLISILDELEKYIKENYEEE